MKLLLLIINCISDYSLIILCTALDLFCNATCMMVVMNMMFWEWLVTKWFRGYIIHCP